MNPVNILVNIAIPVIVLLTLSDSDRLGAVPALLVAIGIPAVWGVIGLVRTRRVEVSAIMGIISVLATGVIGVFELNTRLFAAKEAAIPLGFAAILVASNMTKFPIVTLLADMVQRRDRVRSAVDSLNRQQEYHQHLVRSGAIWAGIMTLSGVLKFALATWLVRAPAGTQAFNHQLAQYELWQLPTTFSLTGVLILSLICYMGHGTAALAGMTPGDVLRGGHRMARMTSRFAPIAKLFGLIRPA